VRSLLFWGRAYHRLRRSRLRRDQRPKGKRGDGVYTSYRRCEHPATGIRGPDPGYSGAASRSAVGCLARRVRADCGVAADGRRSTGTRIRLEDSKYRCCETARAPASPGGRRRRLRFGALSAAQCRAVAELDTDGPSCAVPSSIAAGFACSSTASCASANRGRLLAIRFHSSRSP
jgi:hypothetical protein